jgi:hypothetical protein
LELRVATSNVIDWDGGDEGSRTGAWYCRGRVIPAEGRPLTSGALLKEAR